MSAARHHGDTLSVSAKQRRKPLLTGKGTIATNSAGIGGGCETMDMKMKDEIERMLPVLCETGKKFKDE